MKRLLSACLIIALAASAGYACFGPKLYIGVGETAQERVIYELVALYVKEKTGVQTVAVELGGADPVAEIAAERVDMALAAGEDERYATLLAPLENRRLLSGERPLTDLQFSTVPKALKKLSGLLEAAHVRNLTSEVEGGAPVKAQVRYFLMEKGWI